MTGGKFEKYFKDRVFHMTGGKFEKYFKDRVFQIIRYQQKASLKSGVVMVNVIISNPWYGRVQN